VNQNCEININLRQNNHEYSYMTKGEMMHSLKHACV